MHSDQNKRFDNFQDKQDHIKAEIKDEIKRSNQAQEEKLQNLSALIAGLINKSRVKKFDPNTGSWENTSELSAGVDLGLNSRSGNAPP